MSQGAGAPHIKGSGAALSQHARDSGRPAATAAVVLGVFVDGDYFLPWSCGTVTVVVFVAVLPDASLAMYVIV